MAYKALCQQFYDADKGFAGDDEVEWYARLLPRDAGPVLEAMCGSGRVLVPLLRRGLHVHGADDSAAMLASCEARLAGEGLATPLFRQDVAALNLPFRYGAAFVAAGSLQLVVEAGAMRRALERIRAHLVPPGLLLLDLGVPDVALHPPGAPLVEVRAVKLEDGARITLHSETTVDAVSRQLDMRNRYERRAPGRESPTGRPEGEQAPKRVSAEGSPVSAREDEVLRMTWLEEDEVATLLEAAGFADVAFHASPWPRSGRSFGVVARVR